MPTFPEEESQSESSQSPHTKIGFVLGSGLPVVRPLTTKAITDMGFEKLGTVILPNTQAMQTTFKRGEEIITYNGVHFIYNGDIVQHIEDIKNEP